MSRWSVALALSGCAEAPEPGVRVGVVMTYTGDSASIGFNLERGALMAAEAIGAARAGELPITFEFRDAQGDPRRARRMAHELLDAGVVAVIGPGGDELAPGVVEPLAEAHVPLISPIATTVPEDTDVELPWFRLSPTTEVLGQGLAKAAYGAGYSRVGVVTRGDLYHRRLVDAFRDELERLGGSLVVECSPDDDVVDRVRVVDGVDGIVLALDALPAAEVVTSVEAVAEGHTRWLLTPRVKSDVFLVNTPPDAVEGAIGISADVFLSGSESFPSRFGERWDGEVPFEDTYFMYDAAVLLLVSVDRVLRDTGEVDHDALVERLIEVAAYGGVQFEWDEVGDAIGWNRTSESLQYSGLTGPVLFGEDGQRGSGKTTVWTIRDGRIVNVE